MAAALSRGKAAAPHIASSIRHAQAPQLHCNSTPSFNSLAYTHSGHTAAQNALIAQAPQHLAAAQQTSCTWDIHSSSAYHHHGRADSDRASMKLPLMLHDLEWFRKASLQLRTHNQKSHITTHHSSTTSLQNHQNVNAADASPPQHAPLHSLITSGTLITSSLQHSAPFHFTKTSTHAQRAFHAQRTHNQRWGPDKLKCGQHQASGHHTFRRKPMMQLPTSKK